MVTQIKGKDRQPAILRGMIAFEYEIKLLCADEIEAVVLADGEPQDSKTFFGATRFEDAENWVNDWIGRRTGTP